MGEAGARLSRVDRAVSAQRAKQIRLTPYAEARTQRGDRRYLDRLLVQAKILGRVVVYQAPGRSMQIMKAPT